MTVSNNDISQIVNDSLSLVTANDLRSEISTTESLALNAVTQPIEGDVDSDGDIDRDDLALILSARRTSASGSDDPRDLDGDGRISVLDARKLILLLQAETEFSISANPTTLVEGDDGRQVVVFTVTRSGSRLGASIDFSLNGTAFINEDYDNIRGTSGATGLTGTIHFAPGETEKTILLDVLGDTVFEPDETIAVELSNARTPNNNASISNSSAIVTIENDDEPPLIPEVSISPPIISQLEGDSETTLYTYTVSLSNASSQTITVDYTINDDSAAQDKNGFQDSEGSLTFNPGDPLNQQITIEVPSDTKYEPDEEFTITLNSAINATINPAEDMARGIIENDDPMPTVSISPPAISQSEGDSGTTLYTYTVTLSNPSSQTIIVDYSTNDGSATLADNDYQDNDGSLTFNHGESLTQQIIVAVNGDIEVENDEDFTVTLNSATNANIDSSANTSTGIIENDDTPPPPVPQVSISPPTINQAEGDSGTTLYIYTVTLSNPSSQTITVDYSTNDGSATLADNDYQDNDGILTFNPGGSLTQQIVVEVNGDTDVENDEDFTVTLNSATNATINPLATTGTGIIENDDTPPPTPQVSISPPTISQPEGDSGNTLYIYTITLSNASDQIITVDYSTNDGSATLVDSDYQDNDGILTFNPGEPLTQQIIAAVNGDTKFENDEDFTVTLNSAINAIINPAGDTARVIIENDDPMPTVSISPLTISQSEGDSGTTLYTYTVTLSNASDQIITVDYTTNDGSATLADNDYQDNDGSLTFNPGQPLTQQIIVAVNGDTDVENDEDFTVTLNSATNANINASADTSTGIIVNDDTPPPPVPQVSIGPPTISQPEGDSGTTLYTYTVTLSNASDQIITVDYTTNDGSATLADNDYQDNDGSLTFNPGGSLTQEIVVAVNGDTKFEADEDFTVTLNSANNATINPAGDTVTGVIENDDAMPTISISPPTISQPEGDSGTTLYIYTVTLSNASDQTITVDYSTNDGSATLADNDYQDNDGSLTFNPGDPLTQQIIVEVNGDTDVENDEDFTVTLNSATNATIDPVATTGTGIIENDDTPPPPVPEVSISPLTINQPEGDSGTTLYTYTVTLSNASDQIVTVDYTTNDGSATLANNDYQDNDGILTFNPGEPLTQQIVVAVNGDTDVENDEDFTVTLNGATNANIDASADTSTGIIINDDTLPPIPQVSIGSPTISQAEGDSGTTLYTYTVTLSNANDQIITVDYTTNDGSATLADNDYQDNDGSLTFNPGDELTQEITVAVNGDTKLEGDETFTVRLDLVEGGEVELNPNARESRGIIVNDEPRPKKGVSWGDPHIITFDGLHYEFQTVGDFVLVESDSEDWEIQVRQEPFRGRRQVSSNTAVATLVDGVNVGIYLGQDLPVEIDGTPTSIDNGGFLTVGNSLITRNNNTYSIIFAGEDEIATIEDDRLDTTLFSGHMLVEVFLSNERMGLVQGLLGDGDMDRSNDFAFRNGAVLAQPVPFSQRYGEFADSWRVDEGESLFRDTLTDDPDFPVGGK